MLQELELQGDSIFEPERTRPELEHRRPPHATVDPHARGLHVGSLHDHAVNLPGLSYELGDDRLGSDRGSPNHGSTLVSKRVTEQIRSPERVRTKRPVPWRMPDGARRYAPNAG